MGPSPLWLKQRLMAAGPAAHLERRGHHQLRDAPHRAAAALLRPGQGQGRQDRGEEGAEPGEKMTTLDGVERQFDAEMALVCDAEGPSGIAGIMGGQISEVSEGTTRVLMEAATWVGPNILKTSKKLEPPQRGKRALRAPAAPRLGDGGAAACRPPDGGAHRRAPRARDDRRIPAPRRSPGPRAAARTRLERLLGEARARGRGWARSWAGSASGWPRRGWRSDRRGALTGGTRTCSGRSTWSKRWRASTASTTLPATLPARRSAVGGSRCEQRLRRRAEDALRDRGLAETDLLQLHLGRGDSRGSAEPTAPLKISQPAERGPERDAADPDGRPAGRGGAQPRARAGQTSPCSSRAHVYLSDGPPPDAVLPTARPAARKPVGEPQILGGLMTQAAAGTWRSPARHADFYAARGLADAVLAGLRHRAPAAARVGERHRCRSCTRLGMSTWSRPIRWAGWGRSTRGSCRRGIWMRSGPGCRIRARSDEAGRARPRGADLRARRRVPAGDPGRCGRGRRRLLGDAGRGDGAGSRRRPAAARSTIFDLYTGDQVGEGSKSLALRLEFRAPERTLTDEEVAERRAAIEAALDEIGGGLRG